MRNKFVQDTCIPTVQYIIIYEDICLLGTSLVRPIIARAQIDAVKEMGCQFVTHGCTGKGNDQMRRVGVLCAAAEDQNSCPLAVTGIP